MQLLAALVATHKPIVLVLVHGRPVTFGPHNALLDGVSVVLASWIGGEEHGPAIWSIINGDFNPSGRLAQAWPRSVGYVGTHVDSRYGPLGLFQGDYQGSGWRDGEPSSPLFPFGFGMSFGSDQFKFSSKTLTSPLSAQTFEVQVELSAQAIYATDAGGTVVQLYFSQTLAQAVRPRLMLLAFEKVQRRTATTVTLTVPTSDLGYWHPLTKSTSVDTGVYTLSVGTNSADLHDTLTLTIQ